MKSKGLKAQGPKVGAEQLRFGGGTEIMKLGAPNKTYIKPTLDGHSQFNLDVEGEARPKIKREQIKTPLVVERPHTPEDLFADRHAPKPRTT